MPLPPFKLIDNLKDVGNTILDNNQSYSHRFLYASLILCIITLILMIVWSIFGMTLYIAMWTSYTANLCAFISFAFMFFGKSPLKK
jgi:hypothetical protein